MIANRQIDGQSKAQDQSTCFDPDGQLVRRAKSGDLHAFEQLMLKHNRRIFQKILRIIGNREDAEDEVQETFLRAYRGLSQFREDSKFSSWLTRIAINQALMRLRKSKRECISLDQAITTDENPMHTQIEEWRPNPEQLYTQLKIAEGLQKEVIRLPYNFRAAFVLRYVHEYTTEEVAFALGISIAAVKSRVMRARQRLRDRLGARPYDTRLQDESV
jgi:RNA polymerase sigma-70 factor, ECF subfamily